MHDLPLAAVVASVWTYWFIVGAMSWRLRKRTRKLAGVVPEEKLEQAMWYVWVPMVVLWMALPMIAANGHAPHLSVPAWARAGVFGNVRILGGVVAVVALLAQQVTHAGVVHDLDIREISALDQRGME